MTGTCFFYVKCVNVYYRKKITFKFLETAEKQIYLDAHFTCLIFITSNLPVIQNKWLSPSFLIFLKLIEQLFNVR